MIRSLRRIGGWTNVEVLFREFGASILNHIRIADARPWLTTVGADVPRFVLRKLFRKSSSEPNAICEGEEAPASIAADAVTVETL